MLLESLNIPLIVSNLDKIRCDDTDFDKTFCASYVGVCFTVKFTCKTASEEL